MRTRYYVRTGKVERAIRTVSTECYREWKAIRKSQPTLRSEGYTDFRNRWLLEHHNILITRQANGVEKVGFASRGDMLLFALKWS
jgi:hypothetical protein